MLHIQHAPADSDSAARVAVVYATGYTSFGLSAAALALYQERTGGKSTLFDGVDIPRTDPDLVAVVQLLGGAKAARREKSPLAIRELAKGTRYVIHEYDNGGEAVRTEDEFDWCIA